MDIAFLFCTMRTILFSCFASFVFLQAGAQAFPENFIGHWEGELNWYRAGTREPQKVRMQLIVRAADTVGQYTWQLIYGEKSEDNRPYLLKPVDTARGHWIIDERNGILLDQYWSGNRFTGAFTVQSTTIVNQYWREGELMRAEFLSFPSKPVSTSGNGTEDVPRVDSYALRAYQQAVLKRRK